jgi:hypothetical protein
MQTFFGFGLAWLFRALERCRTQANKSCGKPFDFFPPFSSSFFAFLQTALLQRKILQ